MNELTTFFGLIDNQFSFGGTKYAHDKKKESTDCLFDDFGKGWLYGTMAKYCKRIKNLKRERDILKIATYCFIIWLKRGFHLGHEGVEVPINTTVDTKSTYYSDFKTLVSEEFLDGNSIIYDTDIDTLYALLKDWQRKEWVELDEEDILDVFGMCYGIWLKEFSENAGADQDVFNETGGHND